MSGEMTTGELKMIPPAELRKGDAFVPSLDMSRVTIYRPDPSGVGWTVVAQYERVGDVLICVGTL